MNNRKAYREEMLRQRHVNRTIQEVGNSEQESVHGTRSSRKHNQELGDEAKASQSQSGMILERSLAADSKLAKHAMWMLATLVPLLMFVMNASIATWIIVVVLALISGVIYISVTASTEERKEWSDTGAYGQTNSKLSCPHCNTIGQVRTKSVTQKKGISGGKATGAILTGGLSILATGLSRKEGATEARCTNCNSMWHF